MPLAPNAQAARHTLAVLLPALLTLGLGACGPVYRGGDALPTLGGISRSHAGPACSQNLQRA